MEVCSQQMPKFQKNSIQEVLSSQLDLTEEWIDLMD